MTLLCDVVWFVICVCVCFVVLVCLGVHVLIMSLCFGIYCMVLHGLCLLCLCDCVSLCA